MSDLQELKQEADELGVSYNTNIGANKLQEKLDAHYEAQETSGPALQASIVEITPGTEVETETVKAVKISEKDRLSAKRAVREKNARKTKVITVIDNDQRVNNQTTTCTVNCSNEYFDLGTKILPLNEKIEVAMGHITTLAAVKIPLHTRDNKTGLSIVKLRPRYTISYESV
jgi:hypothetical protein